MPRNLTLKSRSKRPIETFRLQSLVNEVAPILVLSVLESEDKGRGLTAAMIHEHIRGLFHAMGGVTMPPSFLYPLMKSLARAKLITRDGMRYRLAEKAKPTLTNEKSRLLEAMTKIGEYLGQR